MLHICINLLWRSQPQIASHPGAGSGAAKGTLVAAIEELIACIEEGRENRSSGQDGRAALELALAVYQSHARGGAGDAAAPGP